MIELVNIFIDTYRHSRKMINSITTLHTFDDILKLELSYNSNNINVINSDSVTSVSNYSKLGKTCVLNMASSKKPGGGVKNGAIAQEECLFRCSNLTHVVSEDFYPLKTNECLYTKDAIFFKDFDYNYMKEEIISDVITIPAINLNNEELIDYSDITKNKIRLMLSLAISNNVENIILGSFGCGVFKNDPKIISQMFYDILIDEGYNKYFRNIVFSIINDHNSVGNNYDIFYKTFNK